MPGHGPVLAALLEEEARQGRLHQAVLVPLGMDPYELPHGVEQVLGKLVLNRDTAGRVVGDLAHALVVPRRPLTSQPSLAVQAGPEVLDPWDDPWEPGAHRL